MAAISPPGTELRHCRKTFTFNGSAGTGATGTFTSNFTLTGRVVIHKLTAFATTALTTGGGTPTLAMASDSAAWFGTITDARGLAVNTFWNPAGNAANYAVVSAPWESAFTYGNSGELAIKSAPVMTIGGANITGGVLVIDVWYYPITDNGALAGDDIDDTEATRIRAAVGLASANVDTQFSNTYSRIGAPAGASVSADVAATKALLPTALVGGRIDASVGAMASGVVTATAIAADAITDAKVASDVTIASVTGSVGSVTGAVGSVTGAVGSVTGAVGSVTGNVGGNVTGSVGSVATGGITAASIAADAIGASELASDAVAEIAAAVWDLDATAHQTQGTFGQAIGDPVADTGTIFKAVVTDATGATVGVDVVAAQADLDDIQTRIPAALVSGRIDASVGAMASGVVTATAIAADAIGASELAADAVTEIVTGILTTAMTEAYAADGVAPTLAQAIFLLISALTEFSVSGTTITAKKLDGVTTAATFTLSDATNPTYRTRAT